MLVKSKNTFYAGKRTHIHGRPISHGLHRFILCCYDKNQYIDHADHNGLNCQKYNLRLCTNKQNQQNQIPQKGTTSKYKGVVWNKSRNKWEAQIYIDGKRHYLGLFIQELQAALTYDTAAIKYFGEFAYINIKTINYERTRFTKVKN